MDLDKFVGAFVDNPVVKQRVVDYLRQQGGSAPLSKLLNVIFRKTPGSYAAGRRYFQLQPLEFIIIKNLVCLHYRQSTGKANGSAQQGQQQAHRHADAGTSHNPFYCSTCKIDCKSASNLAAHKAGSKHRINQAASLLKQRDLLHANSAGDIVVSNPEEASGLRVHKVGHVAVTVVNNGTTSRLLKSFNLLRGTTGISVQDDSGNSAPGIPTNIPPNHQLNLWIMFQPQAVGMLIDVLVLEFDNDRCVMREVTGVCEPDLGPDVPDIRPTAPFQPTERKRFEKPSDNYVPGEPPTESINKFKWKNPPGRHVPPNWLMKMVEEGRMKELYHLVMKDCKDVESYANKMARLLWIEELQHEVDVRQYDMQGVELISTPRSKVLRLKVPGLAENRPSVMRGDALFVKKNGKGTEYQGYVHLVERDEVHLKFNQGLHDSHIPGTKYDVRFSISRSTFNFMQSAIHRVFNGALHPATILPNVPTTYTNTNTTSNNLTNGIMQLRKAAGWLLTGSSKTKSVTTEPTWSNINFINEEQKTAVRAILSGAHAPKPYLIFGPPGTGKTMTVTEAAKQVYRMVPGSRLMLAAPSNLAADLLALRMIEKGVQRSDIHRCCAFSRAKEDLLDRNLLDITNWKEGNDAMCSAFILPSLEHVMSKRVVVVTCLMAARLQALGVPEGHFTHIFIDEAGHAEEPLALAAMAGLLSADTSARLILAGDPKQLGPVILSPLAHRAGLSVSAMGRLIDVEPYARRTGVSPAYNPTFITKLVNNYRSHEAILSLPNKMFYDGELVCCASKDHTHGLLGFKKLPNNQVPFIFHSVVGKDEREGNSPSWFNAMEAKLILEYVIALQDMRANRPQLSEVGIITPYRKQVQKIRTILAGKHFQEIKVGSVEEFQGQERRAILISTVRSSTEHLEFDNKHRLGFLSNPKRFNVALTRAKALCIIVGNPAVLMHDPCWMALMVYCHLNNACVGSPMPPEVVAAATKAAAESSYTNGASNNRSSNGGTARQAAAAASYTASTHAHSGGRVGGLEASAVDELADQLSRLLLQMDSFGGVASSTGSTSRTTPPATASRPSQHNPHVQVAAAAAAATAIRPAAATVLPGAGEFDAWISISPQIGVEGGEMRRVD